MAKEANTNDEVIEKIKAEEAAKKAAEQEAAKLEAEEAARIKAEQEKIAPDSPELSDEAKAEAEKIMAAERDDGDVPIPEESEPTKQVNPARAEAYAKSKAAGEKLKMIAMSYPQTTPDEHVVFGFAGIRYTLGDLRNLTNIR